MGASTWNPPADATSPPRAMHGMITANATSTTADATTIHKVFRIKSLPGESEAGRRRVRPRFAARHFSRLLCERQKSSFLRLKVGSIREEHVGYRATRDRIFRA